MAEGRTNGSIAGQLVVTEGAVEKHVTNIFIKLGLPPADQAHRRVLAVLRYLEHGGRPPMTARTDRRHRAARRRAARADLHRPAPPCTVAGWTVGSVERTDHR